jgi:hypothetical protein
MVRSNNDIPSGERLVLPNMDIENIFNQMLDRNDHDLLVHKRMKERMVGSKYPDYTSMRGRVTAMIGFGPLSAGKRRKRTRGGSGYKIET